MMHNIDVILGIPNSKLPNFDAKSYILEHAYESDGVTPWPNLKCIIVGNETYNGSNYDDFAPLLAGCVSALINEIKATDNWGLCKYLSKISLSNRRGANVRSI